MKINIGKNFIICGLTGWCMEIIFTAFESFRRRELTLTGRTSIWMFPIYGMAVFIKPAYRILKNMPVFLRCTVYTVGIFSGEFITGSLLKRHDICPWDYSKAKTNINGVIRLDYTPLWMLAGLIFEHILIRKK